jgi:8-oxo-dGTP pyrophosphatase MutT (NUDIX family)
MVVRGDGSSLEVLMLRRSLASVFVSGAYVFPGGALDPGDSDPQMFERCTGRTDVEASALLEVDRGGLAYWVSAFRECFEESGVLLACGPGGAPLSFEDPSTSTRFEDHRDALNAGQRSFLEICVAEDLTLPADALHYVGHWITPVGAPRRYDTRFFAALAPSDQVAVHDDVETIAHMWVAPAEALAQHEAGQIEMLFPTVWNLRLLDRFVSPDELVASVSALGAVPTFEPEVAVDAHGHRWLVVPPDPSEVGGTGDGG